MGKKYNTEEERQEGRKATRRESYYRKCEREGKIPKPVKKRIELERGQKLEAEKDLRELMLEVRGLLVEVLDRLPPKLGG